MILSIKEWPIHDLFFWAASFLLLGIAFSSVISGALAAIIGFLLLLAILIFLQKKGGLIFAIFFLLGIVYFIVFNYFERPTQLKPEGVVTEVIQKINHQELILDNKIKIITSRHPQYRYGDHIAAKGSINKTRSPFLNGIINYPTINLINRSQGNFIRARLIDLRLAFEKNIKQALPYDKGIFLSGLTTGNISEISKEFDDALKASGTSHLVALSGYNINIVLDNLIWLGFWPAVLAVIAFVVMTGAEASLVRAAIMGIIFLIAKKIERPASVRNAITFAALVMVLFNPKILLFDLGFQLSFLALLGIILITPQLIKIKSQWFLDRFVWPTLSAQFAVLPLLILKIGYFNPLSPLANILIAPIIPITMLLGFLAGASGFLFQPLSSLFAWFANILLTYEVVIINLFAFNF